MILFTTGQERYPFDYLLGLVRPVSAAFPGEEILVQYGHGRAVPAGESIRAVRLLSPRDFLRAVHDARVIVSHCGEGTLSLLQEVEKPFVLVPRTRQRREHVDDHQLELASILARDGVPVAHGADDLIASLRNPRFVKLLRGEERLADALLEHGPRGRRVLLVTSSGGHFRVMQALARYWKTFPERAWVTFAEPGPRAELEGESVVWAFHPTNRNLPNLLRNKALAYRTIRRYRPDVILSTGAGVAVPFLLVGKLLGCRTAFVESITRVRELSLSARLLNAARGMDRLVVRHQSLGNRYPAAIVVE